MFSSRVAARHGLFMGKRRPENRRSVNELHGSLGAVCSLRRPDGFGQRAFLKNNAEQDTGGKRFTDY